MNFSRVALVAVVFAVCSAVSAAACAGCDSSFAPVKGDDGLVYINACVAKCSGASVAAVVQGKQLSGTDSRPVTKELMQAYAAEGFRFIDFARVARSAASENKAAVSAPSLQGLPTDRVVRYDVAQGAIYASAAAAPMPSADVMSAAPKAEQQQQQQQQQRRMLRAAEAAPSSSSLQLTTVGQLLSRGQKFHCSAALVGEHTIMTAARCVFDRKSGAFARALYFVPGRFRNDEDEVVAPFGSADVAEVFVMSSYTSGSDADASTNDMALVRLQPTASFGKVIGHMSVAQPAAAAPKQQQEAAAAPIATSRKLKSASSSSSEQAWTGMLWTAGYPGNRAEGTVVASRCSAQQQSALIKLGCRIHAGQAGAPLVDVNGQLRGVVASDAAGGVAITSFLWHNLIKPYMV